MFLYNRLMRTMAAEIKLVNGLGYPNSIFLILCGIFRIVLLNNFFGLIPHVFTATRHLAFTLPLSIRIWFGINLVRVAKNTSIALAHLVPTGTPVVLVPFMVLIETTRSVIRPFTLAIRLAANIIAGHLLLILIRRVAPRVSIIRLIGVIVGLLALVVLEVAVSFIQRYVFSRLISLYISEVNARNI